MSNEQFDRLIEAMPQIAKAVNAFESDAMREKALDSLLSAFGTVTNATPAPKPPEPEQAGTPEPDGGTGNNGGQRRSSRKPVGRRTEQGPAFDKSLSARPAGKESLMDFLARSQPKNQNEYILAIVYWLDKIAEVTPVTVDRVFTGFRLAELKLPGGSLANKVSQTGSLGWLATTTRESVTLSVSGEERILHDMLKRPAKPAKGE